MFLDFVGTRERGIVSTAASRVAKTNQTLPFDLLSNAPNANV